MRTRQERYVRSFDGTQLYTSSEGDGPDVVLCDGIGCDGFVWPGLIDQLAGRFRLIRWHYRGHGLSQMPADLSALSIPVLVRDLTTVLDAYGISQTALMGHSMGVQLILDAALTHPDRVRALVPICGSYGRPLETFHNASWGLHVLKLFARLNALWPATWQRLFSLTTGSPAARHIAHFFEVNRAVLPGRALDPYFAHLARMNADVFVRLLEAMSRHTVEHALHQIVQPALIIAGEHDAFTPMWLSEYMHTRIPNSDLVVVPGGTHVAPLELPGFVGRHIQSFLADVHTDAA